MVDFLLKLFKINEMIKIEIIFFLFFNLIFGWNTQAQVSSKLDSMENRHYFEVIDELFKEVLAETITGEIQIINQDEIGKEIELRMSKMYSTAHIEKLRENIPPNFIPPSKKQYEIYAELIEFNKNVFIPVTAELRERINGKITDEEKVKLSEIKADYLVAIDSNILAKKEEVLNEFSFNDERKQDEIKAIEHIAELSRLNPTLTDVWNNEHESINYLKELAEKYIDEIEVDYEQHKDLRKQWIKIKIGSFGNYGSSFFSILGKPDKGKLETSYVIEQLLLLEI